MALPGPIAVHTKSVNTVVGWEGGVISGSYNTTIIVSDIVTRQHEATLDAHIGAVWALAVCGRALLSTGTDLYHRRVGTLVPGVGESSTNAAMVTAPQSTRPLQWLTPSTSAMCGLFIPRSITTMRITRPSLRRSGTISHALRRRWASAAVRETARALLYRRSFVGAHGDPGDQAGPRGLDAYCEAARGGPAVLSAAFPARPWAQ